MSAPTLRRAVVHYSGGLGSWAAAERAVRRFGREHVTLLFADVIVEDRDLYRFLIEGAAVLSGLTTADVADLAASALALPPLRADLIDERKRQLAALRADTMARLPMLVWLADGRTTFEAMRDARFITNSRVCKAAQLLKHHQLDRWMRAHRQPDDTQRVVGLDWTEQDRIQRLGKSLRQRGGWRLSCPLARAPRLDKDGMAALARSYGVEPSQAYALGLAHDNCSGACGRGGKGHWAVVREQRRDVFDYAMGQENVLRALVGPHAMLSETRQKVKRALPLYEFDARLREQELSEDERQEIGGCGCGADVPDEVAA